MIRAYVVRTEVVGFAHQQPSAADSAPPAPDKILGMTAAKTMFDATAPRLRVAADEPRAGMASRTAPSARYRRWDELPLLWDADFLYGPSRRDR